MNVHNFNCAQLRDKKMWITNEIKVKNQNIIKRSEHIGFISL